MNLKKMNILSDIRNLYTPIQPTIKQSAGDVRYCEYLPKPTLQPYIYCYWDLKTTRKLSDSFLYKVVADGCIDIFMELNNPMENFVMGFCRKYTVFPLENSFHYFGIRFLPAMFPQMFNINASELSNRFESLSLVVPDVSEFLSINLNSSLPINEIISVLDNYFSDQVANAKPDIDNRLYEAIDIILKNYGVLNVETDLNTGISARQLRRLFEFYIGDTPKTFSQVVRFQNILRAKPSTQSLRKNKLFFDAGYYDQAHFIKEFKNFYGVTPSKAFDR